MSTLTCLALLLAVASVAGASAPKSVLNADEFRDKVYACWLGKNIGGTLGAPFEGKREMHSLTFFEPVPDKPTANDDLDLQLLWLKALEERGPELTCRDLGEYWLKYVPVDWNEYGIGKRNMRDGFPPPVSGQFRNEWKDSNGAWIRSEIWACVAPGCPALAARYAWEDACVDHGAAEGTFAELFTASLESAAFVESDRDKLLDIGLSYIPPTCAVAKSINAAIDAHKRGLDLKAAREAVVEASKSTGWFMAPQNVAFVVLGWLYGDGDFGKSLCAAVNCGDDTDCTGATLGSILGIIHGTTGIPEAWRKPVGETILNVAIAGFQPPKTIDELTEKTVAMAPRVLKANNAPVAIQAKARTAVPTGLKLVDAKAAKALWSRSAWAVSARSKVVSAELRLPDDVSFAPGASGSAVLLVKNRSTKQQTVNVGWALGEGLAVDRPALEVQIAPGGAWNTQVGLTAGERGPDIRRGQVLLSAGKRPEDACTIPFALAWEPRVSAADVVRLSGGTTATSDSELDREPGCTAKAIDGVVASANDFEGKRWHSALTPHPHWVSVRLDPETDIRQIVIHFADPDDHPVDFRCEARPDKGRWTTIDDVHGYTGTRRYTKTIPPTKIIEFRLTILKSASKKWPNAAQISEIELRY